MGVDKDSSLPNREARPFDVEISVIDRCRNLGFLKESMVPVVLRVRSSKS